MSEDGTPMHKSIMEAMWEKKEEEDLERFMQKKIVGNPKVDTILRFLSEYCELKLKASWSGKVLYDGFVAFICKSPAFAFTFTNHQTSNISCKSDLKKVCDQVFPYKNFNTKHYYIKTKEHIEIIKTKLKNEDNSIRI